MARPSPIKHSSPLRRRDIPSLERRANYVRRHQQEPKASWPRAGVEVEAEFQVESPARAKGLTKPVYYSGVVGMRLVGGGTRYRCVDEACPLMYAGPRGVVQHLGYRHPSREAMRRRDQLNADLIAVGLEPILYGDVTPLPHQDQDQDSAERLVDSVLAETEPEGALFPAEAPKALSGSIVPPGARRRGRPLGKRRVRDIEDTLDFMGPEIADTAKTSIDYLIKSRDDNRRARLAMETELAEVTAQRDHLAGLLMKIHTMTFGAEIMQIGGTENGQES